MFEASCGILHALNSQEGLRECCETEDRPESADQLYVYILLRYASSDMQSMVEAAGVIANDSYPIDVRVRSSERLRRDIVQTVTHETPLVLLKSLLMVLFSAFPTCR